jgi:hypothetical protein
MVEKAARKYSPKRSIPTKIRAQSHATFQGDEARVSVTSSAAGGEAGMPLFCAFFIAELRAMNWGIPKGITAFLLFW